MMLLKFHVFKSIRKAFCYSIFLLFFTGCAQKRKVADQPKPSKWERQYKKYGDTLRVTASAYNLTPSQTLSDPNLGAWGDTLTNEDKVIAVSKDLLEKGLTHNAEVKIKGLKGVYRVRDRMPSRWRNRIDILMGDSIQKARAFGVQKSAIYFINTYKKKQDK